MRLALKLISRSSALIWGYAPVSPLDKSLFYQNLCRSLGKGTELSSRKMSLVKDVRNFSARWLILKTPLTPLASIEKKTISGFDIRLTNLKGPLTIKRTRRMALPTCIRNLTKKELKGEAALILPFVSQGLGWGARSSKNLSYLRKSPFLTFRKSPLYGFLRFETLAKWTMVSYRDSLVSSPEKDFDPSMEDLHESCFLVSLDTSSKCPLLVERTFFESKGENPNSTPQSHIAGPSLEGFERENVNNLHWLTGVPGSFLYVSPLAYSPIYKIQAIKKLIFFNFM